MRQRQRHMCCDVTVLRTADCWTDHKLLQAQLTIRHPARKPRVATKKRFDVGALKAEKIRDSFCEKVCESVEKHWSNAVNGTGKWEVIRDGFVHAAESVLGLERRRQPDWFRESGPVLSEQLIKGICCLADG